MCEEDQGVKRTWVFQSLQKRQAGRQVPTVHGVLSQGSSARMSGQGKQRHLVIREVISLVITKVISLIVSQASNCWEENTALYWREHLELQCCSNPTPG